MNYKSADSPDSDMKSNPASTLTGRGSWKVRLGIIGLGVLGNHAIDYAFNYGIYPFVMWQLGALYGAVTMTFASLVVCFACLMFYQWTKQDWLGIETLKDIPDVDSPNKWRRLLAGLLVRGDWITLLALSIWFDPFITVIVMRHGAFQFNGLSRRDWRIFFISLLIGNAWQSTITLTGLSVLQWIWRSLS